MKISRLEAQDIACLSDKGRIDLAPGFNLIRGANGAGKTTLLEACALLGHSPLLNKTDENRQREVHLYLELHADEFVWLNELVEAHPAGSINADDPNAEAFEQLRSDLADVLPNCSIGDATQMFATHLKQRAGAQGEEAELRIVFSQDQNNRLRNEAGALDDLLEKLRQDVVQIGEDEALALCSRDHYSVQPEVRDKARADLLQLHDKKLAATERLQQALQLTDPNYSPNLKQALSDEWLLRMAWEMHMPEETPLGLDSIAARLLVLFSRNCGAGPSQRVRQLSAGEAPKVGLVSYFNTDMYDFGIGLDIRESPKDFRSHFRSVIERLGVVSGVGQSKEYKTLYNEEEFNRLFGSIIGNQIASIQLEHSETSAEIDMRPVLKDASGTRIRRGHENGDPISSGENQALFLCQVLACLQPRNSILLLDEADLHLAIPAVSRLIDELLEIAESQNCQIISVTHMPALCEDRLRDFSSDDGGWQSEGDQGPVALQYFGHGQEILQGSAAVNRLQNDYRDALRYLYGQSVRDEADYKMFGVI